MFSLTPFARRLSILVFAILFSAGAAYAQGSDWPTVPEMQDWLAMSAHQGTVAPGTRITAANWRQYQQYMPRGMVELFKGNYYWRMPPDVEIDVGPTVSYPSPGFYVDATEKNSGQVRVVHLPNGNNDIVNYAGGSPFPSPQEPDKGYKLLADWWFAYAPYLSVGGSENPLHTCTEDRFGSIFCQVVEYVYRQLVYKTDPRVPREDPEAPNLWFTEWIMVDAPEQSKYEAQLTCCPETTSATRSCTYFCPPCAARSGCQ
jgi:Protein of unknown function (DUF1329)